VLGLADEVGGDHHRIGVLVGDHEDLRGTGEQIDAHVAEELALGLGDVRVAGTDEQVDAPDRLGAERERRESLHAPEHVDLVGAGQVHRRDGGRRRGALVGRRARGQPPHAGGLRRHDAHVRRGDHRVAASGYVGADRGDRDVAVAQEHAGERLDLDVVHGGALGLREAPYLGLGEADVVERLLVDPRDDALDLRF
jgi:hypothetical protein